MPHDHNNAPIQPGDVVSVPCRVNAVYTTDDGHYCNVDLETLYPMPPYTEATHLTLNSRQTLKVADQ